MIRHCALSLKVTSIHLQVLKKVDVAALPPQFYSAQSIENLDTMFPEISEKCTELEENVCSSKLKQDQKQ